MLMQTRQTGLHQKSGAMSPLAMSLPTSVRRMHACGRAPVRYKQTCLRVARAAVASPVKVYIYIYICCSLRKPAGPRVPKGYVSMQTNFLSVVSGLTEAGIRLGGMLLGCIRKLEQQLSLTETHNQDRNVTHQKSKWNRRQQEALKVQTRN